MEDKILITWWAHSWDWFKGKDTAPLHPWLGFWSLDAWEGSPNPWRRPGGIVNGSGKSLSPQRDICGFKCGHTIRAACWGQELHCLTGRRLQQKRQNSQRHQGEGSPCWSPRAVLFSLCQVLSALGWSLLLCWGVELEQPRAEDVSPLCHPLVTNVPTPPCISCVLPWHTGSFLFSFSNREEGSTRCLK